MSTSAFPANKPCALEKRAIEILTEKAQKGKVLSYKDAVTALARLRVDRRTALQLLAEFSKKGLLDQHAGHGIKLKGMEYESTKG